MTTSPPETSASTRTAPARPALRHFTVDEVERMVAHGVLTDGEPFELWHGALILMSPQSPLHAAADEKLAKWLARRLPDGFTWRTEKPLRVADDSLPEPDLVIVTGSDDDYLGRHPRGEEAALVVEIARTSLDRDRDKAPTYAAAEVGTYWVVDLAARRTEVFDQPKHGRYHRVRVIDFDTPLDVPHVDEPLTWSSLLPA